MITIKPKGGLGNQMFQYAFGRALALKLKTDLGLDTNDISAITGVKADISRPFLLDCFNIKAKILTEEELSKIHIPVFKLYLSKLWRKINKHDYNKFDPKLINKKDGSYFEGLWFQSEKYFKNIRDELLKEFILKSDFSTDAERISEIIKHTESSVCIHIRRGDYVSDPATNKHHGLLPLSYYKDAIEKMTPVTHHPIFFVFSDEIEWVRDNLSLPPHTIFVSNPSITAPEEIILQSLCKHHIIANSSFSWWGAWLGTNPDKIVIAPKQWFANINKDTSDMVPQEWIKI